MPIIEPTSSAPPLPRQPDDVPWPTVEWSTGPLPSGLDPDELDAVLDRAFGATADPSFGRTDAVVVVHGGRLVVERYGPEADATTPLLSWSMAKSITHTCIGILVDEGRLDPRAPAPVPAWSAVDEPRRAITLQHLLRMTDGLDFNETYAIPADADTEVAWSHCIDMLFGAGKADHAGYAIDRPLRHDPGTAFNYSSGTSNIVARILGDAVGGGPEGLREWMRARLFAPIGMTSADPTFDDAGTFVGSSYLHATARDWARFGLLHLRGGSWDGDRIVSSDWVDDERTTWAVDDDGGRYGTHWWTADDGRGRWYASGFGFQRVACVPSSDLVAVRLGHTEEDDYDGVRAWFDDLITLFD